MVTGVQTCALLISLSKQFFILIISILFIITLALSSSYSKYLKRKKIEIPEIKNKEITIKTGMFTVKPILCGDNMIHKYYLDEKEILLLEPVPNNIFVLVQKQVTIYESAKNGQVFLIGYTKPKDETSNVFD